MSTAETTSRVSTKTAQVRNRWIRDIEAAIKAGVPKHVKDGLETAIRQIKGSIEFGGKGHLQERIGLLEYELACASTPWQPIETAPKDEEILVAGSKRMGICVAHNDSRDGWETETTSEWVSIYTPTHWMPLPQPPEKT